MFKNRLEKNDKKLKSWAARGQIEAYRLYDRDIPEFPFIVDRYKDFFVVYDKTDPIKDAGKNHLEIVTEALVQLYPSSKNQIIIKKRERQEGLNQYEKLNKTERRFQIQEGRAQFWVNLYDYLDTGLFLDHRPLRQEFAKAKRPHNFLNLFCYTGAVSVAAALGGAKTTNIDMSRTYLTWAQDNFSLNQFDLHDHEFIQSDVLDFLEKPTVSERFDVIFLDPPTFSNSKRMQGNFEVERDQEFLVNQSMKLLKPDGKLYFSNNKRKFKLSPTLMTQWKIQEITRKSIPQDFHDQKIHQCYEISNL